MKRRVDYDKIILIDDDQINYFINCHILRGFGYRGQIKQFYDVYNGLEYLESLVDQPLKILVFLDTETSDLGFKRLQSVLKELPLLEKENIRFALLSKRLKFHDRHDFYECCKVEAFIEKPYERVKATALWE